MSAAQLQGRAQPRHSNDSIITSTAFSQSDVTTGLGILQCWNYGGEAPSRAIVGPLIGEKKQAPGGAALPPPLSETRATKAGAAQC